MKDTQQPAAEEALALADESLQLIDTLRADCAALEKRCFTLETHIRAHTRETHALLDLVPVALVVTDHSGHIVDANRAAAALLGRSMARLKEELLLHFFDDRAACAELIKSLGSMSAPVHTALKLRPRERAPFEADITLAPDPREGEPRWLWFIARVSDSQMSLGKNGHRPAESTPSRPRES